MTICCYLYYTSEPTYPVYWKLLGLKTSSGIGGDGGRTLNSPVQRGCGSWTRNPPCQRSANAGYLGSLWAFRIQCYSPGNLGHSTPFVLSLFPSEIWFISVMEIKGSALATLFPPTDFAPCFHYPTMVFLWMLHSCWRVASGPAEPHSLSWSLIATLSPLKFFFRSTCSSPMYFDGLGSPG